MLPTKALGAAQITNGELLEALRQLNPLYNMLPRGTWSFPRDFFSYGNEVVPLAVLTTTTTTIQIQADSDFLIVAGVLDTRDGATGLVSVPTPPLLVRITDSGSGRELQSNVQPIGNLFGTGQLPAYWPFPKFIKRSSTLSTAIENLDGALAFNVRYSYLGVKIFPNRAMAL